MENEKNEELITIEVPITAVEHDSMTLSFPPNTALDEIEQTVLALERYGNAVWANRKVTVDSIPMPDSKESVEASVSVHPEELREYLLEQGIWEREVDELLSNFNQVSEDDLNIAAMHYFKNTPKKNLPGSSFFLPYKPAQNFHFIL